MTSSKDLQAQLKAAILEEKKEEAQKLVDTIKDKTGGRFLVGMNVYTDSVYVHVVLPSGKKYTVINEQELDNMLEFAEAMQAPSESDIDAMQAQAELEYHRNVVNE